MNEKLYTPVVGELVETLAHFGLFEVVEVDRDRYTANIRNISHPIYVVKSVAWSELQSRRDLSRLYFKFEDGLEHRSPIAMALARPPRAGQTLPLKGGLRARVLSVEETAEPFGAIFTAICSKPSSEL